MTAVEAVVPATRRDVRWGAHERRSEYAAAVSLAATNATAVRNAEASGEAPAVQHIYSKLYLPRNGMFADVPADLHLGTRLPVRVLVQGSALRIDFVVLLAIVTPLKKMRLYNALLQKSLYSAISRHLDTSVA